MNRYNVIVTVGLACRAPSADEAVRSTVDHLRLRLEDDFDATISMAHAEPLPYEGMNKDQPWFDEASKAEFLFKQDPFTRIVAFPDLPGVWFWTDGVAMLRGVGAQPPNWPIIQKPTTYDRIVGNETSTKRAPTEWERCAPRGNGDPTGLRSTRNAEHGIDAQYYDLITRSWSGLRWLVPTKDWHRAAIAVSDLGDVIAAVMPMVDARSWRACQ